MAAVARERPATCGRVSKHQKRDNGAGSASAFTQSCFTGGFSWIKTLAAVINPPPTSRVQVAVSFG